MKTVSFLIIALSLIACRQEMKTSNNSGLSVTEPGSGKLSVVKPLTAGRTISVGGSKADIRGFNSEAIQTALNSLKEEGMGGKVLLLPGEYDIIVPVNIFSNITLEGSGNNTILKKCKGYTSSFAEDADYGELQVTVKDASGFKAGMGVSVYDDAQRYGYGLTTARIIAIKGNTLFIDNYLVNDYEMRKNGTVSNACSVVESVNAENIIIRNFSIDGSGDSNALTDGCRAGGVYLHKVKNAIVENVTVSNFNCDGISWQITENVTVRNCEIFGCKNAGLHPGTGSPYTLIEGNRSHDNGAYGLFVCWRVRQGEVRNNAFYSNGINGICTGHKDTDMLYAGNNIYENGGDGINLRGETDLNAPHRSIFRENIIENNGMKETAYGFSVNSKAEGVVLEGNIIRSSGKGNQVAAVYMTSNSLPVELKNNNISGHLKGEVLKENN